MAKAAKKVKWSIGADEPEDLQEFLSNDDIVLKHTNRKTKEVAWAGKGPHTFVVRRLTIKPNRNGDDRVAAMLVIQNPKGHEDASWNGYMVMDGFNITEQGTPFLKRFLKALGLTWKDFHGNTKAVEDGDKQVITQIGGTKFDGPKPVTVQAMVKVKDPDDYNDDEWLDTTRYLPLEDEEPEDEVDDEEDDEAEEFEEDDEADEDEEDEDEEDEDEEEDDDEDEDEEDEDEEEDEDDIEAEREELAEELKTSTLARLRKRALRNDKKADLDGLKKAGLIDLIVDQEIPPF